MEWDETNLALQCIKSSADRCYLATGKKCGVVAISQDMAADLDEIVLEVFGQMLVVDPLLPGWSCYARGEIRQ
jgi:hypothetical protein